MKKALGSRQECMKTKSMQKNWKRTSSGRVLEKHSGTNAIKYASKRQQGTWQKNMQEKQQGTKEESA